MILPRIYVFNVMVIFVKKLFKVIMIPENLSLTKPVIQIQLIILIKIIIIKNNNNNSINSNNSNNNN